MEKRTLLSASSFAILAYEPAILAVLSQLQKSQGPKPP